MFERLFFMAKLPKIMYYFYINMSISAQPKIVFLGMSGGVDSSVSAYLLKQSGYDVVGVFIQVWQPEGFPCTAKEDRLDAMRVAAQLDIPFLTLDLEQEYKKGVIDYMLEEYTRGNTPNPDVMCNREVKFGAFLQFALTHGADYVATGHYAQVKKVGSVYQMVASADTEKDQTYFLWTLNQSHLAHVLFPIGHLEKKEVRTIAERAALYTAPKKDSQGLCFIGTISFKELLKQELKPVKGNVLNVQGEIIGVHEGSILYTFGERHGFTIIKKSSHDGKLFVIAKDIEKNTITVAEQASQKDAEQNISLNTVNYTEGTKVDGDVLIRVRYRQTLTSATVVQHEGNIMTLRAPQTQGVTVGQSCVIYSADGARMLGGGIIQ